MTKIALRINGHLAQTLDAYSGGRTAVRFDHPLGDSVIDVELEAVQTAIDRLDVGPMRLMILDLLELLAENSESKAIWLKKRDELTIAWNAADTGEWLRCEDCMGYGFENDGIGGMIGNGAQCAACQGRGGSMT